MYPVSQAFLDAIDSNTRKYCWTGTITTKNSLVYEFSITLLLDIDRYTLDEAEIKLYFHLILDDGTIETIPMGVFEVSEANRNIHCLELKAYDYMIRFDKDLKMKSSSGTAYSRIGLNTSRLCLVSILLLHSQTKRYILNKGKEMDMSEHIHKSHNVSVLLYHFVCPTNYRKVVINKDVDEVLKDICKEIEMRYEIHFVEVGANKDHVHFLIQSIPIISPTKMITMIKSITAKEIFNRCPELKKQPWGGNFWTSGYFVNTVGASGSEAVIREYVKNQGKEKEYKQFLQQEKLEIFF